MLFRSFASHNSAGSTVTMSDHTRITFGGLTLDDLRTIIVATPSDDYPGRH